MENNERKIFDFNYNDCNDCKHYWDDSCDGVQTQNERHCNSFIATRRVDIPLQIKTLESKIKNLKRECFWLEVCVILLAISQMIFYLTR